MCGSFWPQNFVVPCADRKTLSMVQGSGQETGSPEKSTDWAYQETQG
jgi:hypothetical protein